MAGRWRKLGEGREWESRLECKMKKKDSFLDKIKIEKKKCASILKINKLEKNATPMILNEHSNF